MNLCKLTEVIKKIEHDFQNKGLYLGQFLDDFKNAGSKSVRYYLIKDKPDFNDAEPYFKALIASMVHKLCNDYQLPPPSWVFEKEFYLDDVYFSGNIEGKGRIRLLVESPPEFKARNVFVPADSLTRM
ncbi:MAG: hypothetical protein ACOY31_04610 [Bacillota bacterium]